jgi:protein TonB
MLHYTFSGTTVLLGLAALCLSLLVGIYYYRYRHRRSSAKFNPDLLRSTGTVGQLSLCAALLTTFLTINWTQYREETLYTGPAMTVEELDPDIPITYTKPEPPPPPPPPPPTIELTPDPEVEAVEMIDQAITEDSPITFEDLAPAPRREVAPPPPPPDPPAPVEITGPVLFAERMPVFGEDCKKLQGDERKQCSDRALLSFVQSGAGYPALAKENGIQGVVVISFVVEKDGTVSTIRPLREQPGGLTQAALQAVERINQEGMTFSPGIQGGLPVRVAFNLPVKFILSN